MQHRMLRLTPGVTFNIIHMLSDKMKAITFPAYQGNIIRALRSLELVELPMPQIADDEVLIAIEASACNPSDLAFIQGGYNVKKTLPAIPGFEGCGRVISSGKSQDASKLDGKRVSFFSQTNGSGAWATHIVARAIDCLLVDQKLEIEQAACFSVNPFTAYAMMELVVKSGSEAIIQNAAAGQVGKFMNHLANREGIAVINIVRKEEQVEALKETGFEHVLWQLDENFTKNLDVLAKKLNASIAFDAVGGALSGQMLSCMPEGGTLYLYGAMGASTLSEIPASDVIFKRKNVQGFNMNEWKEELMDGELEKVSIILQDLFIKGVLKTDIQGQFPLEEHGTALMQYIRNMSGGKILFRISNNE